MGVGGAQPDHVLLIPRQGQRLLEVAVIFGGGAPAVGLVLVPRLVVEGRVPDLIVVMLLPLLYPEG